MRKFLTMGLFRFIFGFSLIFKAGVMEDELFASDFDPTGAILNETNKATRGRYNSANIATDASFTLNVVNKKAFPLNMELFNAERSITKVRNPSWYGVNPAAQQYGPITESQLMAYIGQVANVAFPATATINANPFATFNDFSGDLIYCGLSTLPTFALLGTGTSAGNASIDAYVASSTSNTPYKSLLDDIATGLILDIERIRIQCNTTPSVQFSGSINFVRYKSFGGAENNEYDYALGRNPSNNLTDTIDLPIGFAVDKKVGLFITTQAVTTLNMTFSAKAYRNNGVIWIE